METEGSPSGNGYWSINQAAGYLGVSPSTVRRKFTPGTKHFDSLFPRPIRIGKLVRFLISEIVTWARSL